MGDTKYDGWTGVQTKWGWLGYAIASILPFFLVAFVLYLLYRLVRRKRAGTVGPTPWFVWLVFLTAAAVVEPEGFLIAVYAALVVFWWWLWSWGESNPEVSEDGIILVAWRRLGRRLSGRAQTA